MAQINDRKAGVLLHITSLPSEFGIGDLGPEAYTAAENISASGATLWQVLPLGPTGYGNSPYAQRSAFAGNEMLISPELLYQDGYLKKEDLLTDGSVQINKYESLKYRFMDKDFIDDMPDDSLIPVMCDDFIGKPDYVRCLSARKGNFKYIVATNPQIGITATVTGYNDKNQILLDYNDCVELIMPKRNLANEKRIPPIGAILRVYPTNWTHNLWRPVEVSEKTSDSYLCFSFDNLPIVFSEIQWKELEKELNRKNLLTSTGDWKIAPLDESRISRVEEVKLQLDNEICLSAKIINDGEKLYFSY